MEHLAASRGSKLSAAKPGTVLQSRALEFRLGPGVNLLKEGCGDKAGVAPQGKTTLELGRE